MSLTLIAGCGGGGGGEAEDKVTIRVLLKTPRSSNDALNEIKAKVEEETMAVLK